VSVPACAERSAGSFSSDMAAAAERSLKDLVVHNRKKTLLHEMKRAKRKSEGVEAKYQGELVTHADINW